jgi:hypothetical protein
MTKGNPLFSQQLKNISREAIEKHQDIVRRYVLRGSKNEKTSQPCIYWIIL